EAAHVGRSEECGDRCAGAVTRAHLAQRVGRRRFVCPEHGARLDGYGHRPRFLGARARAGPRDPRIAPRVRLASVCRASGAVLPSLRLRLHCRLLVPMRRWASRTAWRPYDAPLTLCPLVAQRETDV